MMKSKSSFVPWELIESLFNRGLIIFEVNGKRSQYVVRNMNITRIISLSMPIPMGF